MDKLLIAIILALILTVATVTAIVPQLNIFLRKTSLRKFEAYAILCPYSFSDLKSLKADHEYNFTYLKADLDIIKNMGFEGVSLFNLECFMDDEMLEETIQEAKNRGLKVTLHFWWRDVNYHVNFTGGHENQPPIWTYDFPYNQTQNSAFIEHVKNVTLIARNFSNMEAYLMFYPFDHNNKWGPTGFRERVKTAEYQNALQEIIDGIWQVDASREIYLATDILEQEDYEILPYNMLRIDGFAFAFYSLDYNNAQISRFRERWNFFEAKSKQYAKGKVMLAEWGFKTTAKDLPIARHGWVKDEESKAKLIEEFVNELWTWNIKWAYFSLHDFPPEEADWGLVNDDQSLKLSGEKMKEMLGD